MKPESAIAGINLQTSICDAVALISDSEGLQEMSEQGLLLFEVSQSDAKQMLGNRVKLPYAFAC